MNEENIRRYARLMTELGLTGLEITQDNTVVRLERSAAPAENADPFVRVGDRVAAGQTLCIIEAMKLMNEIPAECGGKVVEICVGNGQNVDYGCTLFKIRR